MVASGPTQPAGWSSPAGARLVLLTTGALTGFAANSLLCRAALGAGSIDAASFTGLRLLSGAATLAVLARFGSRRSEAASRASTTPGGRSGSWASSIALLLYALPFSLAYLRLDTGVGALVLFGAVQMTMLGRGLFEGERPAAGQWLGLLVAFAGLVVLTSPGASAPDPVGIAQMALAGVAWGVYSLRGRGSRAPLRDTADNFARSLLPAVPLLALLWIDGAAASPRGWLLAVGSGALASGVGYSLWYAALPALGATRAASLQLLVPVLAAWAGAVLLGEGVGPRLLLSAAMILGGVGSVLRSRTRTAARRP